ncbi:MAG: TetR/AcrR family transcriptional regulator C-terminal domain-containing protein [Actinobacteria bacterium]|nr:TetR/AcrR family transcriptional regulator C-terminal domain-containing protein [Actinomycetota bacterium]
MPARKPVTRERALAEAVALADADGIDAVSMRNLAARLDVVPMALYKHVTNKSDLLDGMVETLVASYDQPAPDLGWKDAVRAQILSARDVLLAHPWARQVIETRTTRTPEVLGYMNRLSGLFIEGGFSPDLTHHAMHALGHRIWGFSPEAFDDPDSLQPPADLQQRAAMFEMVQQTYPYIAMIALDSAGGDLSRVGDGCDEQFEFEFTLDLLLDAFERLHEAGWRSR